ncbi:calponin-1-like isoform X5 [Anser cygnoides]|uniref:calponin-1-like isoform X5 n=1 Tax=Anser cygnoides TaxID=8845 RepID=UPI0034D31669
MSNGNFNRGPAYGLSAEVKNKLAQKYDPQRERELRAWIEGATGRRIGDNFMDGLKDGVILCELINKLQPGSVQKVNDPVQNWHKGVWGSGVQLGDPGRAGSRQERGVCGKEREEEEDEAVDGEEAAAHNQEP